MKKALLGATAVIAAMFVFPATAVAGQTGEYTYEDAKDFIYDEAKENEIFLTKYIATPSNATKIEVPAEIDGKTVVGLVNTFYDNHSITEVTLPEGVRVLGQSVFNGCENLADVSFPSSLEVIGDYCFSGSGIRKLILPESITSIGRGAFRYCDNLISADLSNLDKMEWIASEMFEGDDLLEIFKCPPKVKSIGNSVFSGCVSLTTVELSSVLESIGGGSYSDTFSHCTSLREILLPDTLKSIGSRAFMGCVSLKEINLPAGIDSVGFSAFFNCPFVEFVFPENLRPENIEEHLFPECDYLERLINESSFQYGDRIYVSSGSTWFLDEDCSKPAQFLPAKATIYRSNAELYATACEDLLDNENLFGDGIDMIEVNTYDEAKQYIEQLLPEERKDRVNITIDLTVSPAEAGTEDNPDGWDGSIRIESITISNKNSEYGSDVCYCYYNIKIKAAPYSGSDNPNRPGGNSGSSGNGSQPENGSGNSGNGSQPGNGSGNSGNGSQPGNGSGNSENGGQPGNDFGNSGNGSQPGNGSGNNGNNSQPGAGSNSGNGNSGSGNHSGSGSGSLGSWHGSVSNGSSSSNSSGSGSGSSSASGGSRPAGGNGPAGAAGQVTVTKPSVGAYTWEQQGGKWKLRMSDGSYASSQWGLLGGKWYLFGEDAVMLTGWQAVNGIWYYLEADGSMATGWRQVGDKWYYLNEDGGMAAGWKFLDGKLYYLNEDGDMATGWIAVGGKWYYMDESGALLVDTVTPDGYAVNTSGEWIL